MIERARRALVFTPVALLLAACASGQGAAAVAFPHRVAPPGYPTPRREDLSQNFAVIPEADVARALAGRRYRVRWGALRMPGPDQPIDARTGEHGFPADGPFELEMDVAAGDVHLSVVPADTPLGGATGYRLVGCVDVQPSNLPGVTRRDVVVLDVQPIGDSPELPLAIDAVTGERLAVDASRLLDENNAPCDRRRRIRDGWDDNLQRLHRSGPR